LKTITYCSCSIITFLHCCSILRNEGKVVRDLEFLQRRIRGILWSVMWRCAVW
jgi:hypothetical protein